MIISCSKLQSNNPFDPDCPKELFTPSSFRANQNSDVIELNWDIVNKNISGYKIKKSEIISPVNITDIAPTVSQFLNIQYPSGCNGKPIIEVLK